MEKENKEKRFFIGEHSVVGDEVEIKEGAKIMHFCNLYGNCKIGKDTLIGSYCEIKGGVVIGDNCRFQANVMVSEKVTIGNNVFIGPNVAILNDMYPTVKKTLEKTWKCEPAIIGNNVTIGSSVTVLPGVKVGNNAFIGAGTIVAKDVPEYAVAWGGNFGKIIGDVRDKRYKDKIENG